MTEREAYDSLARTPGITAIKVARWLKDETDSIKSLASRHARPVGQPSPDQFVTPACPGYPQLLKELGTPPLRLFHQGLPLERLSPHLVAVVGSRNASRYGLEWARNLGATLASHGISVCSGLAAGIDAAAHEGALEAVCSYSKAGIPVAVLGHGLNHMYPESNRHLREVMKEKGVIVSEYVPDCPPARWTFPERNRIIAGLCQTVVIVEAGPRSGSLHTARFANDAGRDVWVLPNRPGTPNSAGVLSLLEDGATPLISIEKFVEELVEHLQFTHPAPTSEIPKHLYSLLQLLATNPGIRPESIRHQLELKPIEVSAGLAELELLGFLERDPHGSWELTNWQSLPVEMM